MTEHISDEQRAVTVYVEARNGCRTTVSTAISAALRRGRSTCFSRAIKSRLGLAPAAFPLKGMDVWLAYALTSISPLRTDFHRPSGVEVVVRPDAGSSVRKAWAHR